jgi:hypothetical protein
MTVASSLILAASEFWLFGGAGRIQSLERCCAQLNHHPQSALTPHGDYDVPAIQILPL